MVRRDPSATETAISGSPSSVSGRERLLDAAVEVALRDGILAMTLDAVAKQAGVSKGGLLYHFRSKDELIAAMLLHFRAKTIAAVEARVAADPNPRGRWFRASLETIFGSNAPGDAASREPSEMAHFFTAMLTALANNPELLGPVRERNRQMRERMLAEGPNGLRQVTLFSAIHGLLLWQNLGLITPDDPVFQAIINDLLTLAEGPNPSESKE